MSHRLYQSSSETHTSSSNMNRRTMEGASSNEADTVERSESHGKFTVGLFVSALMLVLSCGVIFLIGVNIVIQYRTINWNVLPKALLKLFYILLSFIGIYVVNKFNVYFFNKMNFRSVSNAYASISPQEPIQMRSGV